MIILAPMQGLTEILFRKTYEQCFPGAIDYAISPFLSLTHGNLADAWKKIDDVIPENNVGSMKVVPQILGKEPEEFVGLANRLGEIGYDEVNWNLGCPMRRVAHKHRGSGILPYPDEIKSILDAVMPRLNVKLSIKMRLGYYDKNEIDALIPILNAYDLKSITIHPRIGKQMYNGQVDMEKMIEVAGKLNQYIIYNGDIETVGDYKRVKEQLPMVKDVMIGRGILYDPLLPLKIKGKELPENGVKKFIKALMNAIEEQNIDDGAKWRKIKEYWCLIEKSLPISEQCAREVLRAEDLKETKKLIEKILNS